jgi:hypothetical protein
MIILNNRNVHDRVTIAMSMIMLNHCIVHVHMLKHRNAYDHA